MKNEIKNLLDLTEDEQLLYGIYTRLVVSLAISEKELLINKIDGCLVCGTGHDTLIRTTKEMNT